MRLLLGAPANQSRSAAIQVLWGLEKHDIMHSPVPPCENKEYNIFISLLQTTVDDTSVCTVIPHGPVLKTHLGSGPGAPACAAESGRGIRPHVRVMADGEATLSVDGTAVMGA